jgi:hypothetical protein
LSTSPSRRLSRFKYFPYPIGAKKSELNEKFSSFQSPWVYITFDLGWTIFDPEANTARGNNPAEHNAVHGGVIPVQTSFRKSK